MPDCNISKLKRKLVLLSEGSVMTILSVLDKFAAIYFKFSNFLKKLLKQDLIEAVVKQKKEYTN